MSLFGLHSKNIGVDLGTDSILVTLQSKGILINEPAIIAIEQDTSKIVAVGKEAKEMIGKTPDKIDALRPLKHAGIADLKATEMIVKDIIKRIGKTENIGTPKIVINVHIGMTEVEKRAVLKLVYDTGAKEAYLVEEPIAAALGANLDIYSPEGTMVVDLGAGTTEVAVIALGKIVACDFIKMAGDDLDQNIIDYIKKNMNVEIGKNAAEKIKKEIASTRPTATPKLEVKGRDLVTGLPKQVIINGFQVYDAIKDSLKDIIEIIKATIDRTPPELIKSIKQRGITITGGGANIQNFAERISQEVGVRVFVAERPLECVAIGIGKIIENESKMKELKRRRKNG